MKNGNKLWKFIFENAAIIITLAVVVVLAMVMYTVFGFRDEPDEDFWVRLLMLGFIQILMISVWVPEGKQRAEKDERYISNKKILEEKIYKASAPECYNSLEEFCNHVTEQNREAKVAKRLAKVGIAYHKYNQCKDDEVWVNGLKPKARAVVKYLRVHTLRVKSVKINEVIGHQKVSLAHDVWNHEKFMTGVHTAKKLISALMVSVLCAYSVFGKKEFNMQSVADFAFWLMTIGCTIFFSLRAGKQLVLVTRMDYIIRNIDFFNAYDAYRIERGLAPVTQDIKG